MSGELKNILKARREQDSRPGKRSDQEIVALSIEGGGMRGACAGGMVSALHDLNLTLSLDRVYGSSAGAAASAFLLAGNPAEGTSIFWRYLNDHNWLSLKRVHRFSMMNLNYLFDEVLVKEVVLDFRKVAGHPVSFHPVASSPQEKRSLDLSSVFDLKKPEEVRRAFRFSATVPLVAGDWQASKRYCDPVLYEPIPYYTPLAQGCSQLLVFRTAAKAGARSDQHPLARHWYEGWGKAFRRAGSKLGIKGYPYHARVLEAYQGIPLPRSTRTPPLSRKNSGSGYSKKPH